MCKKPTEGILDGLMKPQGIAKSIAGRIMLIKLCTAASAVLLLSTHQQS